MNFHPHVHVCSLSERMGLWFSDGMVWDNDRRSLRKAVLGDVFFYCMTQSVSEEDALSVADKPLVGLILVSRQVHMQGGGRWVRMHPPICWRIISMHRLETCTYQTSLVPRRNELMHKNYWYCVRVSALCLSTRLVPKCLMSLVEPHPIGKAWLSMVSLKCTCFYAHAHTLWLV